MVQLRSEVARLRAASAQLRTDFRTLAGRHHQLTEQIQIAAAWLRNAGLKLGGEVGVMLAESGSALPQLEEP